MREEQSSRITYHPSHLPTRLCDPGYVTLERQFAEAYPAKRELAQIRAAAAAASAPVVNSRRKEVEIPGKYSLGNGKRLIMQYQRTGRER